MGFAPKVVAAQESFSLAAEDGPERDKVVADLRAACVKAGVPEPSEEAVIAELKRLKAGPEPDDPGQQAIVDFYNAEWQPRVQQGKRLRSARAKQAQAEGEKEDEQVPKPPAPGEGHIDLSYESGSADPQPLRYAKLNKMKPGEDFRAAQERVRAEKEKE